jgi:hypothetical protein
MSTPNCHLLSDSTVPLAIYLGIPFCERACSFCHYLPNLSFRHRTVPDSYVAMLARQAREIFRTHRPRRLASCYFGGGTPSLLSVSQLRVLFETLDEVTSGSDEVSMEVHPATWRDDYLEIGRFNRFSLGVQTFSEAQLQKWGRSTYSFATVEGIVAAIRGHSSSATINLDLLFQDAPDLDDLRRAHALSPDSITLYPKTGPKFPGQIQAIEQGLDRAADVFTGYEPLTDGSFIFLRHRQALSLYAQLEYESAGEIVGLGHNSVSSLGSDAYLSVYDDDGYQFRPKYLGDRYFRALLRGLSVGVTEKLVRETDSNILPFLQLHPWRRALRFLPRDAYHQFYEYLREQHLPQYGREFLRTVLHGEDRPELLQENSNVSPVHSGGGN